MVRKMVDFKTITVVLTEFTSEVWHQKVLSYLADGWEVFNTHYLGVVGPEISFAYDLVKYQDVLEEMEVTKKRGRPAKVVAEV